MSLPLGVVGSVATLSSQVAVGCFCGVPPGVAAVDLWLSSVGGPVDGLFSLGVTGVCFGSPVGVAGDFLAVPPDSAGLRLWSGVPVPSDFLCPVGVI